MPILANKARSHAALLAGSDLDRQIKLEAGYRSDGIANYLRMRARAEDQGDAALLKPAERLVQHWYEPVEALIRDRVRESGEGYFVGAAITAATLRLLPSEVMAALVMRDCLGLMLQRGNSFGYPFVSAAYAVGRSVLAEYNLKQIKAEDRDAARILTQHIRRLDPRKIQWWARRTLEDPKVDRQACIHTGVVLIDCLVNGASSGNYEDLFEPAFEIRMTRRGKLPKRMLCMSQKCKQIIEDGHAVRKVLRPRFGPMLVHPFPWSRETEGGYATLRTPMISFVSPRHKDLMDAADMSQTYAAINALASTPWRINSRVLAVARQAWSEGGNTLGLPPAHDRPIPPFPPGFNPNADNAVERWANCAEGAKQAWKGQAKDAHIYNHSIASSRTEWICKLDMAERNEHERRLYFPHQLDFRGRAYPIPLFLNHQGDDVCRGLLQFANPIAPDYRRLSIHAANCYGVDKVPYAAREEWVRQHATDIASSVIDPMGCEFWKLADKPWQFLAACFALDDPESASLLPTQWDGSCNGLQHYAALTLDAEGGRLVNLVPGDTPADVYSTVCGPTKDAVEADAATGNDIAKLLIPLVSRSVVKQPVMTQTYGVTMVGAKKQIMGQLRELGLDGDPLYKASQYLANKVMGSVASLCPGATAAMEWLRACAKLITAGGQPVEWTTPLGFPVTQGYRKPLRTDINTSLGRIKCVSGYGEVKPGKQIQSFPPNFVHSIDATHMMMTALACQSLGVEFAGVHDSYWTHAGTANEMNEILREKFVMMHSARLLYRLSDEFRRLHPKIEFPEPPIVGTLDLSLSFSSPYLFH